MSGTESDSRIAVQVDDGGGSASFNLTVNMNGATAPAPAIIGYMSLPERCARRIGYALEGM
ncbi:MULTISPECIES: hypothetical protein [Sorangium]|uniref:hypothetical protein n=1 Tax=Sorangium TaxID=39643 RepID=UPI001A919585|nr:MULTISPECIES: hypothetical protein [Sorangium]